MTCKNAKSIGNISEAKTLFEFQKYGIQVYLPWGDNERCDMIAEFNGKLNKIQVKTANEIHNGAVRCYCRSSTNHTTNKHYCRYIGQIDYFVFYNQTYDLIAIVPIEEVGNKFVINLRITPTKNNQSQRTRDFSDFSFDKLFGDINHGQQTK